MTKALGYDEEGGASDDHDGSSLISRGRGEATTVTVLMCCDVLCNPELSQQDDEIELDIDSLDIQTLWELYSFVTGYKESLSIKKEEDQGFGSERDAESAHNIIQEPATGTERSRVTESGKAIRMSSSPVRQENKAGGSSSYNSSSSDSGSSSSDSDSDSSSGRGSDTGN
ncbi:transcription factor GTE5, chloroplastic-like [Brassica napus]|uniref:transcription factor GTE5, chloroplastic-like n=1 Tax=Brassica napus TaxID=3708 RepID=UPI002079C7AE|nr:transcription factor GTE5, chloroplastic-like [Brassica napus]